MKNIYQVNITGTEMLVEATNAYQALEIAGQHYNDFVDAGDGPRFQFPEYRERVQNISVTRLPTSFVGGA